MNAPDLNAVAVVAFILIAIAAPVLILGLAGLAISLNHWVEPGDGRDSGDLADDPYPASLLGVAQTPLERKLTLVEIDPVALDDDDHVEVQKRPPHRPRLRAIAGGR